MPRLTEYQIEEENQRMLRRQADLRIVAQYVAEAFAAVPEVQRVTLFGSVANPLRKEIPRFRDFIREGIEIYHECKDIDLAVSVSDTSCLRTLQKARAHALQRVFDDHKIGIAHHKVDIFFMDPHTNAYQGRLCHFTFCPRKTEWQCQVPGCGATRHMRIYPNFDLAANALRPKLCTVLFEREGSLSRKHGSLEDRKG